MSENHTIAEPISTSVISISATISHSYLFFMDHFKHFVKLAAGPIIIWVLADLMCEILFREYNLRLDSTIPRTIASASFALVWYRQFLLGSEHATYSQLFDHVLSPGIFNISNLIKSFLRIILTSVILFIPTLILSLSFVLHQYSQGIFLDEAAIQDISFKSTSLVLLLCSPIFVRLSLYTVGFSLGRRVVSLKEVWQKTSGITWTLWLLILRAFLPISLYSYFITWGFGKIASQFSFNYIWANLFINIPTAFLTFMLLAIVVAANGSAFRMVFNMRIIPRTE